MSRTLRKGCSGADVQELQISLLALGKDPGVIDGIFGEQTRLAVVDFQDDFDQLDDDGIVGPATREAIDQALGKTPTPPDSEDVDQAEPTTAASVGADERVCCDETWAQFQTLIALLDAHPVVYGPGRGLWHDGKFVITYGPGKLGSKDWKAKTGKVGPSFHCSSWTNFVMGVLARRNEEYTHAGNIPALSKVCEAPNAAVTERNVGTWRGYGDICVRFMSDGSTRKRGWYPQGGRIVDLQEIWQRRSEMPTFFVCGQSSKRSDGNMKWWHHTVLFVIDHRQDGSPLYRIAADGLVKNKVWSAGRMVYRRIDADEVAQDTKKRCYRGYVLRLPKSFSRPVAEVVTEDQL